MATPVDIYEAFKDKLGAEAARMLADSLPERSGLITRSDGEQLRLWMDSRFSQLEIKIADSRSDIFWWMLAFFVPIILGTYGTLAALLAQSFIRR